MRVVVANMDSGWEFAASGALQFTGILLIFFMENKTKKLFIIWQISGYAFV